MKAGVSVEEDQLFPSHDELVRCPVERVFGNVAHVWKQFFV